MEKFYFNCYLKAALKISFTLFHEECRRKLTTIFLATDFLIQTPFPYKEEKIYIYIYVPRGRRINFIFARILQKQSLHENGASPTAFCAFTRL